MRALVLMLFLVGPAFAGIEVWVDAHHGDDTSGLGSELSPFRTITKGVAVAGSMTGSTVHVLPGLYDDAAGEVFPIQLANQMSVLGSGAQHTIVSGGGAGTLFRLGRQTILSDLGLQRADIAVESLGQAFGAGDMRALRRCIVRNSDIGVRLVDDLHSDHGVALVNCFVTKNLEGVVVQSTGNDFQSVTLQLHGTTVTGNDVALTSSGPGAERYLGMSGSIVRGNDDDILDGWLAIYPSATGNVLADPAFVGLDGNVDVDPGFVDADLLDVHLRASSTIVDLAAPAVSWPPQAMWVASGAWIWDADFAHVADFDGDLRDVVDPGADERSVPTLSVRIRPQLGHALDLWAQTDPFAGPQVALGLDLLAMPVGLAQLRLALPIALLGELAVDGEGTGNWSIPLPPDPLLEGVDLYLQAFSGGPGGWVGGQALWLRLLP